MYKLSTRSTISGNYILNDKCAVMLLKQLQRLTLSATRRNADIVSLGRFYGSPAVCESSTTSNAQRHRDDRRALVESFVNEYRAANDGQFPAYTAAWEAIGGSYRDVKVILQELEFNAKETLPIVAKALSEESASLPNDAFSMALKDPQSHTKAPLPIVAKTLSEVSASIPDEASSQIMIDTDTNPWSHSSACNAKHFSATVVDHRTMVESFVNKYRAANDGQFPAYTAAWEAIGGSYRDVKVILQELKLNAKETLPIVANALSEESASVPNDASSLPFEDSQLHVSTGNAKAPLPIVAKALSEVSASTPNDASSQIMVNTDTDPRSHRSACNVKHFSATFVDHRASVESFVNKYREANDGQFPSYTATWGAVGGSYRDVKVILQELKLKPKAPLPITAKAPSEESVSVPNDSSSQTMLDTGSDPESHSSACNVNHSSATVVEPRIQADTVESGGEQKQATLDSFHPNSDEIKLQGNNLVTTADHGKIEIEKAPNTDVDRKGDPFESQVLIEECSKKAETGEEPIADHLEGAGISENIEPTVTRQVVEKEVVEVKIGEKPSAWSNIMSFAKEFANFWR